MKFTLKPFFKLSLAFQTAAMLFVTTCLFSQENAEEKILLVKAAELAHSNPDETIKIANHLLKKSGSYETATRLNLLISRGYIAKGDYNKSLGFVFEAGKNEKKVKDSLKAEILFFKAEILRKLHLYKLSDEYLTAVKPVAEASGNNFFHSRLVLEQAFAKLDNGNYPNAMQLLEALKPDKAIQQKVAFAKGMAYAGMNKNAEAEQQFNIAFRAYNFQKIPNRVFESKVLNALADIAFEKKEYQKSIDLLLRSLEKATAVNNLSLQEDIYYQLAANYLSMNHKTLYKQYYDKFLSLNIKNNEMENEAVNSLYNLISQEQEANYEFEKSKMILYTYISIGLLAMVVVSGAVLYRLNKSRSRRLKEIIGYLEVTNNLLVKSYTDKKEPSKKITISTETEQVILAKLKKFESSSKYTNKDMSLATLAAQLDVNTKYLSEVINKHYHDNFNTYINRLRINYIIEKLKNEPEYLNYKISYLAEESGFSSHSSFATVFKSITGIAPTVFIELIGKEVNQKKA